MTTEHIRAEIDRLVEAGDEAALEAFVLEHFAELPEETQGTMLLSYFKDAVERKAADAKISELQEKALDAMEILGASDKAE